jgi:RNA polymerase sigma-70 factor (family 1)
LTHRTHDTDLNLFQQIAAGDELAFTEIYIRYSHRLLRHIGRLLDSELWAEEIVQDVFVKLWEIRNTLAEIENPSAYIFRIASNKTLDHLRHKAVETKMQYWVARNAENAAGSAENETENQFDFRISKNMLKEAVNGLSLQKQLIYRLKHEDGRSYEEIATELKLSRNTVRNHLADALQFIRRYLLQQGVFTWIVIAYFLDKSFG